MAVPLSVFRCKWFIRLLLIGVSLCWMPGNGQAQQIQKFLQAHTGADRELLSQGLDSLLVADCPNTSQPDCQQVLCTKIISILEDQGRFALGLRYRLRLLDITRHRKDSLAWIQQAYTIGLYHHWQRDSLNAQAYFWQAFQIEATLGRSILSPVQIQQIGGPENFHSLLIELQSQAHQQGALRLVQHLHLRLADRYLHHPGDSGQYLRRAHTHLMKIAQSDASVAISKASDLWASYLAGLLFLKRDNLPLAEQHFTSASAQYPEIPLHLNWRLQASLAQIKIQTGAPEQVHRIIEAVPPNLTALQTPAEQHAAYKALLTISIQSGYPKKAVAFLDSLQRYEQEQYEQSQRQQALMRYDWFRSNNTPLPSQRKNKKAQPTPFYWALIVLISVGATAIGLWFIFRKRITSTRIRPVSITSDAQPNHSTSSLKHLHPVIKRLQVLLGEVRYQVSGIHPDQPFSQKLPEAFWQRVLEKSNEATILLGEMDTFAQLDEGKLDLSPSWALLPVVFQQVHTRLLTTSEKEEETALQMDLEAIERREGFLDEQVLSLLLEKLCVEATAQCDETGEILLRTGFRDEPEGALIIYVENEKCDVEPSTARNTSKNLTGNSVQGYTLTKRLIEGMGGSLSTQGSTTRDPISCMVEIPLVRHRLQPSHTLALPEEPLDILIVEDVNDMGNIIQQALSTYHTLWLPNGRIAWDYLQQGLRPKLILSDIVMPHMSGLDFLERLRADPELGLTPVIFLTALGLEKGHQYKGFALGIDDYIVKPFSLDFLEQRVQNTLKRVESRRQKGNEDGASQSDLRWLREVDSKVQASLGDHQFGVEILAQDLQISNRHLGRRLREITGLTPGKYITELRMHHARQLLEANPGIKIGDLAQSVGYQNPEYFSRHFKQRFGLSPSSYLS
ncbi:MAG: helix-turn-helix domain-containing protein [Bacteroidota bacterium]